MQAIRQLVGAEGREGKNCFFSIAVVRIGFSAITCANISLFMQNADERPTFSHLLESLQKMTGDDYSDTVD